jgi:hypothetical protein
MKRLFVFLATAFVFTACNNDNAANDAATKDPSEVHPDTLQLINDSVVVADPSADPGVKAKVGSSDSIQRKQ